MVYDEQLVPIGTFKHLPNTQFVTAWICDSKISHAVRAIADRTRVPAANHVPKESEKPIAAVSMPYLSLLVSLLLGAASEGLGIQAVLTTLPTTVD